MKENLLKLFIMITEDNVYLKIMLIKLKVFNKINILITVFIVFTDIVFLEH